MIELDPRRSSMGKMMIAVAAELAFGTATMAIGTMAFGRGGGGGALTPYARVCNCEIGGVLGGASLI
jgi:hypothetical protein